MVRERERRCGGYKLYVVQLRDAQGQVIDRDVRSTDNQSGVCYVFASSREEAFGRVVLNIEDAGHYVDTEFCPNHSVVEEVVLPKEGPFNPTGLELVLKKKK